MNVRIKKEQKIIVSEHREVFLIMQQVLMRENKIGRDKEHFWIIGLSANHRILFIELISLGTVCQSLVHPMEVFSFALQKRAVSLILVHNHPSGDLEPSFQDKDITDRLLQNSLFLEVPVVDHMIISETAYFSFAESGLMKKLRQSTTYVTPYKQEEDRLKNEGKKEMAKAMKQRGLDQDTIAELSGLPVKEIEKL